MPVSWWVELVARLVCLADLEKLTGEMVASVQIQAGVLGYQRFISGDRRTIYLHERDESSKAAAAHLRKFGAT
jgi:quinol monooxygenase YgiN